MRAIGVGAFLAAAFAANTASAQDTSMNNTMAVPMPGTELDNEAATRAIVERRHLQDIDEARVGREQRAAWFEQKAATRRAQANALAAALSSGIAADAGTPASIRQALEEDLNDWREQFNVRRREWRAMRDLWLPDGLSLTAAEWAARRLDWFAARDAWIAERGLASP